MYGDDSSILSLIIKGSDITILLEQNFTVRTVPTRLSKLYIL